MNILSQVHKKAMKSFLFFYTELTIYISKEHFVIKKEIELNLERQVCMMETRFCYKSLWFKKNCMEHKGHVYFS